MHRAILQACLPCVLALAAACLVLALLVRFSGARLNLRRLRELHGCQDGGVQSLAFVLTLPIFVMVLLFIVQVSQLMIGLILVNYAAFAAARSASVWLPAFVDDSYALLGDDVSGENESPPGISPGEPFDLTFAVAQQLGNRKYDEVFTAAVLAIAPVAPSRSLDSTDMGVLAQNRVSEMTKTVYALVDSSSASNPRIPGRLDHKLAYSMQNTLVRITFEDRNSQPRDGTRSYNPLGHATIEYYPPEVGWQDPITVAVFHDFALLPGPGRFLDVLLPKPNGAPDRVSPRIDHDQDHYTTMIYASATMTAEGFRSLRPFVHPSRP